MVDERSQPIDPKWGPLPESLREKRYEKEPCEVCGRKTLGSVARWTKTRINVELSGMHLCPSCERRLWLEKHET